MPCAQISPTYLHADSKRSTPPPPSTRWMKKINNEHERKTEKTTPYQSYRIHCPIHNFSRWIIPFNISYIVSIISILRTHITGCTTCTQNYIRKHIHPHTRAQQRRTEADRRRVSVRERYPKIALRKLKISARLMVKIENWESEKKQFSSFVGNW